MIKKNEWKTCVMQCMDQTCFQAYELGISITTHYRKTKIPFIYEKKYITWPISSNNYKENRIGPNSRKQSHPRAEKRIEINLCRAGLRRRK